MLRAYFEHVHTKLLGKRLSYQVATIKAVQLRLVLNSDLTDIILTGSIATIIGTVSRLIYRVFVGMAANCLSTCFIMLKVKDQNTKIERSKEISTKKKNTYD